MYINGRKITIEDLEHLTHNLISTLIDDLYKSIMADGVEKHIPGVRMKQRAVLTKMIDHYLEREEYEKCATLRDMIKF
jgi:hypothetical protein